MCRQILIHSGEGEVGTFEVYKGKDSTKAIKTRLTKERNGGDRWADAWESCRKNCKPDTYASISTGELRTIPGFNG